MKTGVPTRFKSLFYGIKGYDWLMKTFNHLTAFDKSEIAKLRLESIEFLDRFGLAATLSAYKISKATLYRWKKTFTVSRKQLTSLIPQSTKPKRVRQRLIHPQILAHIKALRLAYGKLGKDKLKPLIDEYCLKENLEPVSASTIGRVITDNHCFYQKTGRMYHNPSHGWAKRTRQVKKLRQRHAPKPTAFGHIEIDSLVKLVDGMRIYLITAVDVKLKFSFALPYSRLNSQNSLDCLKKLQFVYPFPIKTVQTDNGLEFLGDFEAHLKRKRIKHLFTYPRCPRINGVVERFNRTIKEDFLNPNLNLIHNPEAFHGKLIDYLLFFNTKRPHQSLGQKSPLDYALEKGYLSQMYWTSTFG